MTNICKECIEYGAMFERDKQLSEAYAKINEMKCCGNCANYVPVIGQDKCCKGLTSTHEWEPITGFSKCDKWEMR